MRKYTTHKHYHDSNTDINVAITENRAPTDDSVKLLNEFQEKAHDNIIETVHLKNSQVELVGIWFIDNPMFNKTHYHIRFKINDTEHEIKDVVDRKDMISFKETAREILGRHIAKTLMMTILNSLPQ